MHALIAQLMLILVLLVIKDFILVKVHAYNVYYIVHNVMMGHHVQLVKLDMYIIKLLVYV